MRKYEYNDDLLNRAIGMLENGESITKIAEKLNVCRRTLGNKLNELGYSSNFAHKKVNYKYDYNSKKFKAIAKEYDDGQSLVDLAKKYSLSVNTIKKCCKFQDIPIRETYYRHRNFDFNINKFEKIDTEEKAYWLGFLYADGYVEAKSYSIELCLQENDYDHILKFVNFLELDKTCIKEKNTKLHGKYFKSYRVAVRSKKMYSDLVNLGCIPNKSLVLTYPKNLIPKRLEKHFIRGYFDGDGCISISHRKDGTLGAKFSIQGTEDVLSNINSFLVTNGKDINSKAPKKDKRSNVFCIAYGGPFQVERIYKTLYKNSTISLERKKDKFVAVLEYNRRKF